MMHLVHADNLFSTLLRTYTDYSRPATNTYDNGSRKRDRLMYLLYL